MAVDQSIVEKKSAEIFVTISETAISQVKEVIKQQNRDDLFLRLFVQAAAGGISFGMALDARRSDDDHTCTFEGI
jgi:Fe-S cluster assembly iron-binding protein IscA